MVRHSRNCTAGAFFTYHERQKVEGVGTQTVRLGADDMRRIEDCWLCLRPAAQHPVCTKNGYVYCKACLLLNLEQQRNQHSQSVAAWKALAAKRELDEQVEQVRKNVRRAEEMDAANISVPLTSTLKKSVAPISKERISRSAPEPSFNESRAKRPRTLEDAKQSAFWIVENTPSAPENALAAPAPEFTLRCPASGIKLRLKELVNLRPKTEEGKWLCHLTSKTIGTADAFAVKSGGAIISKAAVEAGLLEGGGRGGSDIQAADLIPLVPGGTAFAARNPVEAKLSLPAFGG